MFLGLLQPITSHSVWTCAVAYIYFPKGWAIHVKIFGERRGVVGERMGSWRLGLCLAQLECGLLRLPFFLEPTFVFLTQGWFITKTMFYFLHGTINVPWLSLTIKPEQNIKGGREDGPIVLSKYVHSVQNLRSLLYIEITWPPIFQIRLNASSVTLGFVQSLKLKIQVLTDFFIGYSMSTQYNFETNAL